MPDFDRIFPNATNYSGPGTVKAIGVGLLFRCTFYRRVSSIFGCCSVARIQRTQPVIQGGSKCKCFVEYLIIRMRILFLNIKNSSTLFLHFQAVYIAIAAYNLFATIYLIFYFEPMRKLMRRDLNQVFGIDTLSATAKCAPLKSAADIQTEHFERLQVIWSTSIRPRSA